MDDKKMDALNGFWIKIWGISVVESCEKGNH